jgi:hypothetical protein
MLCPTYKEEAAERPASEGGLSAMETGREVDELAPRGVALVIFHEHSRSDDRVRSVAKAEAEAVAGEAHSLGFSPLVVAEVVLGELRARYEPEMAGRLHRDYLSGFSAPIPIDDLIA